jgi:hypothetical protein
VIRQVNAGAHSFRNPFGRPTWGFGRFAFTKGLGQQVRNEPAEGFSLFLLDLLEILQNGGVYVNSSSHDASMMLQTASDVKDYFV